MNINVLINSTKQKVKELTANFPYSEEEINLITICYIAISAIDSDIEDLLDDVLSRIFIAFNYGGLTDLFKRELNSQVDDAGDFSLDTFDLEKRDYYQFIAINVCNMRVFSAISIMSLIRTLLHEIKHAINSIINAYETNGIEARCYTGFSWEKYNDKVYLRYLEEAFNSFITNIYCGVVALLKEWDDIEDEGIAYILALFEEPEEDYYSYECTHLLKPIFKDKALFKMFYNAALYKDFDDVYAFLLEHYTLKNVNELDDLLRNYEHSNKYEIWDFFRRKNKGYPRERIRINTDI